MKYMSCFTLGLVFLHAWITEGKPQSHGLGLVAENSSCGCVGDMLTFSCTVSGGISTVWQGSAFDHCRIALLHSHFAPASGTSGACNHGSIYIIMAQSEHYSINYATNSSYYTSQLRLTATPDLNNTNIQCLLHTNSQLIPIGSYNISLISEYVLSPPTDIYLSHVNYSHISFAWTPLVSLCQHSTFFVYSSNCGECPSLVDKNEMTCMDMMVDGRTCSFHIQRIACNVTGKNSSTFSILPKLPEPPNVTVSSHYNTENLTWLEVQISSDSSQEPFMHTAHTIDYVDALSGYKCNSNIFEASSCRGSKCTALFDPSSSSCATPSKLNITVFTNNSFGAGQASQPITIDQLNRFLNVTFESISGTIICSIQEECNTCTCHIEYGVCNNHSTTSLTLGNPPGNTGQIKPQAIHYCYSASTTMETEGLTVVVHGVFYSDTTQKQNDSQMMICKCNIHLSVIYALGSTIVISLITALFVAIISCIYVRSRLSSTTNTESIPPIYDDLQDIQETSICIYADKNVAYSTS